MKEHDLHKPEQRRDTIKSHLIAEHRHDPYKARGKLPEPSLCPQCGAVFQDGRWQWAAEPPTGSQAHICPACHRINDRYPAGEITSSGGFLAQHAAEIVNLARNVARDAEAEHPLQRIMDIEEAADHVVITTTDPHLARRIGHAIVDAYKGDLDTHYDEAGYFARVTWRRDA